MPDPPKAFPAPLGDRYELTELLGRGAMGSVYRARDKRLERDVALKVVNEEQAPQRLERFRREGEITASLDHPGIVRLHTAGTVDDCPYLAYELLEGCQTLGEALPGKTLAERVALIRDAATALGYAHERGVIHRDVKNENLLVDENGRLHVADFGLATAQGLERLTRTGALVGTPTHMSPEMIRGKQGIGPQTDVWGLGIVLYQALTGELPFQAATFTELTARILSGTYQDPRSFGGDVPGALIAVCARALAVDPERRYPTGAALAADLEAWLDGRSVSAHTSGLQRLAAVLILVVGVVAVAFALDRAPAKPALVSDPPVEVPALPLPRRATQSTPTIEPGTRLGVLRHGQRGRTYGRFLSETEALTWGEDGTLRRWDLKRRVEVGRHTPDVGPLTSLGLVGEGVVLAGSRGVIWIPKLSQREPPRTLLGPPGAYAILPLPNRDSVIVARANKELVEVDLRTASVRRQLLPNKHPVYVLGRSTDHARILTSSGNPTARVGLGDQVVRVIDVESGERVSRTHFQTRASAVAFLPGQRGYLVGTGIGRLAEFDALGAVEGEFVSPAVSSKQVMKRLAHDGTVLDLVFTPDAARVFSLSCGAVVDRSLDAPTQTPKIHTEVRLWRLADRTEIGTGLRFERRAYSLALSPSSTRLLIGSEGCVELWSAP